MENPKFLKEKYPSLHASREAVSASRRAKVSTGESIPQNPEDRIGNLLGRYEHFVFDPEKRRRLREMVMNEYVRENKEKMAKGAAVVEERAARQLGINVHYGDEALEMRGDIAVEDLEKSLDQWINYFSDPNEPYAPWFRYYAFRSILSLGRWDKDEGKFPKRSPGTNFLFPDIDRSALGYVQDMISAAYDNRALENIQKAQRRMNVPENDVLTQREAREFARMSFADQYAEGIKQKGEITSEMKEETKGMWIAYRQGSDPTELWKSLQNKGTSWCTAGFGTAKAQLEGGDFYVYYTPDKYGNPTIPRIAIRMQKGEIFEARGVADKDQNLEANMVTIAEEKIDQLPGAEKYRKASADMKRLTGLEEKVNKGQELSIEDLRFIYEVDSKIQGFGYEDDPRIAELRLRPDRDPIGDAKIIYNNQIAWGPSDVINERTKAYIGSLFPGIFEFLPESIEIYTSFPEGKIGREILTIGGKTKDQLQNELKRQGINVSDYAESMMRNREFEVEKNPRKLALVRLTISTLGFERGATTDEIYAKAQSLGLELCPAEVGPSLRLKYKDQPLYEWLFIGMKQVADSGGGPDVFILDHDGDGLWLDDYWASPDSRWRSGSAFVFSLRK